MKRVAILCAAALAASVPAAAHAGEVFGGAYVHDVKLPTNLSGFERGADLLVGYRGGRIGKTPLHWYVFGALNTAGETSYVATGLSARFGLGDGFYIRPGLGVAVHNGSAGKFYRTDIIAFGSRVLFEPELGVGVRLSDRATVEASWVHMSHAQLFGGQNPGMDNVGVRLSWKL